MKTLRIVSAVFLLSQILLIAWWIIPGAPLNDVAWGFIFLPFFIWLFLATLGFSAIAAVLVGGFIVWVATELKAEKGE